MGNPCGVWFCLGGILLLSAIGWSGCRGNAVSSDEAIAPVCDVIDSASVGREIKGGGFHEHTHIFEVAVGAHS
jgi:hypothetical protein